LFLYAENIVTTIFGHKYYDSAILVKIVAFSIPCIFNVASIILVGKDRQRILSQIMLGATIVNILANIVLIHSFEIKGAAAAVTITYTMIFFMSHYYLRKTEAIKMVPAFKKYITIGAIVTVTGLFFEFLTFKQVPYYASFLMITILYGMLTMAFVIDRDDFRIIREMLGMKR